LHDWTEDVRAFAGPPGPGGAPTIAVCVVPSPAGVSALRTRGKQHLAAEWQRQLAGHGLEAGTALDWRLTEELPAAASDLRPSGDQAAWLPIVTDLVVDRGAGRLDCGLRVPFDMPIFRGHFPSRPIVPGVLQVGWAVELARAHELAEGRLGGIVAAKFRRLVRPGMLLDARLNRGPRAGQIEFQYASGHAVVATGRLQFEVGT
jgi:3-hydroxymyristoyl/3-hydroxydecanoyl-(acyl carrier protein) dehydratase